MRITLRIGIWSIQDNVAFSSVMCFRNLKISCLNNILKSCLEVVPMYVTTSVHLDRCKSL
jgi:hypothetical protein